MVKHIIMTHLVKRVWALKYCGKQTEVSKYLRYKYNIW